MVTRRPDEREPTALDRGNRTACREGCRLEARRPGERVRVEPRIRRDSFDEAHVGCVVDPLELLSARRRGVDVPGERLVQSDDARLVLGMRWMCRRVETRERRMTYQVQPRASSKRRATPATPSSLACAAAASQFGVTSGSGGSGASRSIVAMRR